MADVLLSPVNIAHMTIQRHEVFRAAFRDAEVDIVNGLEDFIVRGRYRFSGQLEKELKDGLPGRIGAIAQGAINDLRHDLERMPSLQSAKGKGETGAAEVRTVLARAGQILLALRLDGEDERLLSYLQGVMARMIEESAWAVQIIEEAKKIGVEPADLAPSALAAALFDRPVTPWATPSEALHKTNLEKLTKLTPKQAQEAAENLFLRLKAGDELVEEQLEKISVLHRTFLERQPHGAEGPMRFESASPILTGGANIPSKVDIKVLSGFLSSGRGGSDQARLSGVVSLLRDLTMAIRTSTKIPMAPWDTNLVVNTMQALTKLTQLLKQERLVHRKVEQMWRAMDDQVKRAPKKEGEKTVLPLPRIEPMDARGMYYQHALVAGMPLSLVLAEIYDSDEVTFGPTERSYFEKLALYSARRYAADLAASVHPVIQEVGSSVASTEYIRSLVRMIESELRQLSQLSNSDLKIRARDEINKMSGRELKSDEIKKLLSQPEDGSPSLIEEMVLRIRAEQEVRLITAQLILPGDLSSDVISALKQLPHAGAFAEVDPKGLWFWNQSARNGQSLHELEGDTRARWLRYRQEASAYKDVLPVALPSGYEDVASHNPLGIRPTNPSRRDMDKKIPEVDDDDPIVRERPKAGFSGGRR